MSSFRLLVSIVPHNKAELISDAAVAAGSFGGTVAMGRGISANAFVAALGIGDSMKDIVYILTEEQNHSAIYKAIVDVCLKERRGFGMMFCIAADSLMKAGNVTHGSLQGDEGMANDVERDLITVILNKGYADDAMAAARKAGAGGGTVINARGTAREDDAKFFGMHIVPEKEMLCIVVEHEKKDAVLEAIRTLPCLSEPGSGIAFCSGVNEFVLLGKKN
ncbi:MAG: transcriptional regulator [Treponema sp.]|nr:transcriptional regulator [Treponema sp.]